jgi:hypothetical protein
VLPLVVAVIVAFILVRALVRRPRRVVIDGEAVEVREAERPVGLRIRRPRMSISRRHPDPRTASEAYVASLEILAQHPDYARGASETPAEHADRIRVTTIGLPVSRLAADYALAEFGRRALSPAEHRRAVERWRRVRSSEISKG